MNLAESIFEHILFNNNEAQIVYKEKVISGREIVKNSLALSRAFKDLNFMSEQRVVLVMKDTPAFVYAFLGLVAIGCVPVPVNPKIEEEVLSFILDDSRASGVIIDSDEYSRIRILLQKSEYLSPERILIDTTNSSEPGSEERMHVNDLVSLNKSNTTDFPFYHSKPCSIAFWQYTSGTTGMPKAVQHSQEAMLSNTNKFAINTIGINRDDKVVSVPKMFFGYGLGNSFFFPLITGASVLLDSDWPSLEKIIQNIRSFKPTVFFGVPKMYSMIMRNTNLFKDEEFDSIRIFFSAGAHLPEKLNEDWRMLTGKSIVNGIGCTEIGHVFLSNNPESVVANVSGWPVAGYDIRITDLQNQDIEVSIGSIGELCVKCPYELGKYWENHSGNEHKFRQGWYYSGDLCKVDESGGYVFLGRKDNLFKINGRWVNPEEIEIKILSLFGIEECALVEIEDEDELNSAILFAVCKKDYSISTHEFLNELNGHFPGYKRPKQVIFLDELPKNANGKISRRSLKVMFHKSQNITDKI